MKKVIAEIEQLDKNTVKLTLDGKPCYPHGRMKAVNRILRRALQDLLQDFSRAEITVIIKDLTEREKP